VNQLLLRVCVEMFNGPEKKWVIHEPGSYSFLFFIRGESFDL